MAGRPETYTIERIVKDETWQGNNDLMRTLEVQLVGEAFSRKAMKAANDPLWLTFPGGAPSEGGPVTGWLDEGKVGLAKDQSSGATATPATPQANGQAQIPGTAQPVAQSTGTAIAQPQKETPRDIQAKHTASMSNAIEIYQLARTESLIDKPADTGALFKKLLDITEQVKATYPKPGQENVPGLEVAPEEQVQPQSPTQPVVAAPDPTPAKASTEPPF